MINQFSRAAAYIAQKAEDVGFGMILPLDRAQRAQEATVLTTAAALVIAGMATDFNVGGINMSVALLAWGTYHLGELLAEYESSGSAIRQRLDSPALWSA